MNLPKSLLVAISTGVLAMTITSCEKEPIEEKGHTELCEEGCTIDHATEEAAKPWNCIACGMG